MRESGNKEPLVSVIVPIYNVVDFINRGIEFLFKQDFTDFEVLLIVTFGLKRKRISGFFIKRTKGQVVHGMLVY